MVLLFLRRKVIYYSTNIFFHIFSIYCSILQNPRTIQAKHGQIPIIHLFHNDLCFIHYFIISFTNNCTALGTIKLLQLNLFPLRVLRIFSVGHYWNYFKLQHAWMSSYMETINIHTFWKYYFRILWACLNMPDHTQQKLHDSTVALMALQLHLKYKIFTSNNFLDLKYPPN